jgi:hypothetical protein
VDDLVGFHVGFWDYLTFLGLFLVTATCLAGAVSILGLPGRIAIARRHPEADAVNMMGWIGFLAVVPWIQALMWAFKPTDVVDLRYLPEERQRHTDEMIARLTGKEPSPALPEERQRRTDETIARLTGKEPSPMLAEERRAAPMK